MKYDIDFFLAAFKSGPDSLKGISKEEHRAMFPFFFSYLQRAGLWFPASPSEQYPQETESERIIAALEYLKTLNIKWEVA